MLNMIVTCPYCGNETDTTTSTSDNLYCTTCGHIFSLTSPIKANFSTAPIENNITVDITTAANAARGFYYMDKDYANVRQSEGDSLTVNAKSITINDDKISITIDKDNIDKFYIIEINGVKFVREEE